MDQLFQWLVSLIKDARFWAVVLPWQRAVRVRFGRRSCIWEPGFHLRVPFFDDVKIVNTRLRIASVPSTTITTRDGRAVTLAAAVGFSIVDPLLAIMRTEQPETVIASFVQAEFARRIGMLEAVDIVAQVIEDDTCAALIEFAGPGYAIDYVRFVEVAHARVIRLLQDTWRPTTGHGEL